MTNDSPDQPQTMRILIQIAVKYPLVVNFIDAHFARAMQNLLLLQQDTYMDNLPFGIIEKNEVARKAIADHVNHFPLR